jgi:hypothetical protein
MKEYLVKKFNYDLYQRYFCLIGLVQKFAYKYPQNA